MYGNNAVFYYVNEQYHITSTTSTQRQTINRLAITVDSSGSIVDVASIQNQKYLEDNPLPALTNNAGKVLTVNSGADGVEWTTPASGLPAYTSSDANKLLVINPNGNGVEWLSLGQGLRISNGSIEVNTDWLGSFIDNHSGGGGGGDSDYVLMSIEIIDEDNSSTILSMNNLNHSADQINPDANGTHYTYSLGTQTISNFNSAHTFQINYGGPGFGGNPNNLTVNTSTDGGGNTVYNIGPVGLTPTGSSDEYTVILDHYESSGGGGGGSSQVADVTLSSSNYSYSNGLDKVLLDASTINSFYDGRYDISIYDTNDDPAFGCDFTWDGNGGPTNTYYFGENNENTITFEASDNDYDTICFGFDGSSSAAWDNGYRLEINRQQRQQKIFGIRRAGKVNS